MYNNVITMTHYSFDIRDEIRDAIGYQWNIHGDDRSTVSVTDSWNDTIYIPLLLPGEVRSGELPTMPFIEMNLISAPAITKNIYGDIKRNEAYIDLNLYYANQDNISATTFGRVVANRICDLIDDYRISTTSAFFIEVINSSREIIEITGRQPVFHRVIELKAMNYHK